MLMLEVNTSIINSLSVGGQEGMPGCQLFSGDCLEALKLLPDESVDLILIDPPYGINYLSRNKSLATTRVANDGQEAYSLLDKALAIAVRKLKRNRHVIIFTNFQAIEFMLPIVRKYLKIKGVCVWVKNNGTRGDLKGAWSRGHEELIHAANGRPFINGKRDLDVFEYKRVASQHMRHPTEKPVELLKYIIEKTTQPGETVLDFFAGSGSTGQAAQETGRRSILMELVPELVEVASERLGVLPIEPEIAG
jgi:site-specific DNA-methyltransferase (adenine-specific)